MIRLVISAVQAIASCFRSRCPLVLEIAALRQQLTAYKVRGRRSHLRAADRIFWVLLHRRRRW